MKQVFNTDELAKIWVNQTQDAGRTPGNRMHFADSTIYSYGAHFPIASFFNAPNGETVVLFTTQTNSSTTGRHIRAVASALRRSNYRVVYCGHIDPPMHPVNLFAFHDEMEHWVVKHAKARKPELYSSRIKQEAKLAREYCEVMCLPVPAWATLPGGIEAGAPLIAAMRVHAEESHA